MESKVNIHKFHDTPSLYLAFFYIEKQRNAFMSYNEKNMWMGRLLFTFS